MQLTRVTKVNFAYFRAYLPPGRITSEQEALGLISEDGSPCVAAQRTGSKTNKNIAAKQKVCTLASLHGEERLAFFAFYKPQSIDEDD